MTAEQFSSGVVFAISGYKSGAQPVLKVVGTRDYGSYLMPAEHSPASASVRMVHLGVTERNPVNPVKYTWTVGDKEYTGTYVIHHPDFAYPWKLTETKYFRVIYANETRLAYVGGWEPIYEKWAAYFGLEAKPQTVIIMPSGSALRKVLQYNDPGLNVSGLWVRDAGALMVDGALTPERLTMVVTHELVHAMLFGPTPSWWNEGIATYVEVRQNRLLTGMLESRYALLLDSLEQEPLELAKVNVRTPYPRDPYTVGLSFMLYLRSKLDDQGLARLATLARGKPLDAALKEVLGESLSEAEANWLRYLKSEQFRQDIQGL